MSSIPAKDVIYIDVDDEITTIIDKVRSSQSKILALVLPKRATTLQSIVNMKLLKRSSDEANKHLVLITSEAGLLPLAANVGLYVAKTLQSKPEIPEVPHALTESPDDHEEAISLDDAPAATAAAGRAASGVAAKNPINQNMSVGELSKGAMPPSAVDDAIDFDNDAPTKPGVVGPVTGLGNVAGGKKPKGPKNKSLSVPNFDKFRLWLILGGAGFVLLIVLLIVCLKVLPKASILVKTDSTAISANIDVTLNPSATSVREDAGVVPAKSQQTQKTYTQQASATGQKNNGQKASGTITVINCNDQTVSLPAGTGFSAKGMTFVSTSAATAWGSNFKSDGTCKKDGRATVRVVAQNQGAQYNLDAQDYSIANGPSDVTASGDPMTGGTDEIIKIVQQADIDGAKAKLESQDSSALKQQLQNQLTNMGLYPVAATFSTGTPNVSTNVKAGDQADSVTVTETISYTMLGATQADLKKLVKNAVADKIDESKQSITDYGLGKATFTTTNAASGNVAMAVTAVAGPDLKIAELKKQVAGKKTGDATKIIKSNPGVTDVTVDYSPFWVTSIPGNEGKITITIDEPQNKTNAN